MRLLDSLIAEARAADMKASEAQGELTERLVMPAMPEILAAVTRAREKTNAYYSLKSSPEALAIAPEVAGDSNLSVYPIGFCAAIRDRVYAELAREPGIRSLRSAGVLFNKVFIVLRNSYCQNAIQLGNIYIDAANDTVDPAKPFLEWKPVAEVDYRNIESWPHAIEIAEKYYYCRVYPNLCFPLLAPLIPLFAIRDNGRLDLLYFQNLFFLKDLGGGLSEFTSWLSGSDETVRRRLPAAYQDQLARRFGANDFHVFPFEFRPSSIDEILAQAREMVAAARDPAQSRLIVQLMDMAPQAVNLFRRQAIATT